MFVKQECEATFELIDYCTEAESLMRAEVYQRLLLCSCASAISVTVLDPRWPKEQFSREFQPIRAFVRHKVGELQGDLMSKGVVFFVAVAEFSRCYV